MTHCSDRQWQTSTASADPTGLLDMLKPHWSAEILGAIGIDDAKLPRPDATRHRGRATSRAKRRTSTGLPAGTPVIAGGGDGQCAGTGAGVHRSSRDRAYINLGTAVVSGSYGSAMRYHRAFRTENRRRVTTAISMRPCLRTGTFLVDWMARELFGTDRGEHG